VPQPVQRQIAQLQGELARLLPGVRWADPATVHLTLRFFGDVAEEALENIGKVMLCVGRLFTPFQIEVAGVGAFPSTARPRVIWLGMTGGESLKALHAALDQGLREIGFPGEERPFTPHLTLGRSRERQPTAGTREILERFRTAACGRLPVDRLVLFESRLHPSGAMHLPRNTVLLGRSDAGRTG
jgi:2'-5' RNA ligase